MHTGSGKERAVLVKFMQRTYQELFPDKDSFAHLAVTVERYLSPQTPLWWVVKQEEEPIRNFPHHQPIACLWLGNGIDQVSGARYAHIFLLYVSPEYRRQGIGKFLVHHAQNWAKARGDSQIGLQVFTHNQNALHLYQSLGYQAQSLCMIKPLD